MRYAAETNNDLGGGEQSKMTVLCDKKCILIADDEEQTLAALKAMLSEELPDYEVDLAANGSLAIENFIIRHHGVILMDLEMPVMDGHSAFCEIKKICKEKNWAMPSVIFCVGYNAPDEIEDIVKQNPMHCILPKPLRWDDFFKALHARLR